jgi:hypothetical protein
MNKEQDKTEINERLLIKTKKNIQNYLSKESRQMG